MGKYKAYGELTLQVSKVLDLANEKMAVEELVSKFNTYGIKDFVVKIELNNGEIHELTVHDHEIDWDIVDEIEIENATGQII